VLRVWSTAGVQTFEYEFNDAVEVISLTDPRGSVTTYQNDVMGRPTVTIDALGTPQPACMTQSAT